LISTRGQVTDGGVTDWQGETLAYLTSETAGDADLSAMVDWVDPQHLVRTPAARVTFTEYGDDPLMAGAAAPYLDDRIQVDPLPIIRGVPTTLSARLTNPNDFPILVNATFGYADYGLGLTFGPVGEVQDVRIEANSDGDLQVPWTPPASGHLCIRLNYTARPASDQHLSADLSGWSQCNLNIQPGSLGSEEPEGRRFGKFGRRRSQSTRRQLRCRVLGREWPLKVMWTMCCWAALSWTSWCQSRARRGQLTGSTCR
jgi:hypothetical protein